MSVHPHGPGDAAAPPRGPRSTAAPGRAGVLSRSRVLAWLPVPLGLVLSAGLVWHTSTAAFTATTVSPNSTWNAGSVVLRDDDADVARFTATRLKPGDTDTRCIAVTYDGTLATGVRLYITGLTTGSPDLGPYVRLTIDEGTGGGSGSCTGFSATSALVADQTLTALAAARTNWTNGLSTWAPTGAASETRTYRIQWTLDPATPNTAQGGSTAASFTWEARTA